MCVWCPSINCITWATVLVVVNFKHIHEREPHEVLLAILNKKKKLSFGVETEFDPRQQNYEVQIDTDADVADTDQVVPIPCAKEATSGTEQQFTHRQCQWLLRMSHQSQNHQIIHQIPILLQTFL